MPSPPIISARAGERCWTLVGRKNSAFRKPARGVKSKLSPAAVPDPPSNHNEASMSGFILAIDQGTTSSRAIVFDRAMKIVASGHKEFAQHYPASGWVEHDPEEIWQSVVSTCREALKAARLTAADISAIGITNQRETVVIWDKASGKPIHNAIVWQDRRTVGALPETQEAGAGEKILGKDRPAARPLFLRHQDRLAARQGQRRAQARRARRAARRHHRQFPDLAADRRQAARDRRHQCLAHAGLQHRAQRMGRRAAGHPAASRRRCCRR